MERFVVEAAAFRFSWNKTAESHSDRRAYLKRVCRLRFSFFAMTMRSRAYRLWAVLREGAARAATVGRPARLASSSRLVVQGL